MPFGPARRAVKDTKLSYREAHTSAHFSSYNEKSLLVVKDYVFLEKNQNKDAQDFDEAFHGMPDGVNIPRYMWDTAQSLARRDIIKKKKQKTWMPNGGGKYALKFIDDGISTDLNTNNNKTIMNRMVVSYCKICTSQA